MNQENDRNDIINYKIESELLNSDKSLIQEYSLEKGEEGYLVLSKNYELIGIDGDTLENIELEEEITEESVEDYLKQVQDTIESYVSPKDDLAENNVLTKNNNIRIVHANKLKNKPVGNALENSLHELKIHSSIFEKEEDDVNYRDVNLSWTGVAAPRTAKNAFGEGLIPYRYPTEIVERSENNGELELSRQSISNPESRSFEGENLGVREVLESFMSDFDDRLDDLEEEFGDMERAREEFLEKYGSGLESSSVSSERIEANISDVRENLDDTNNSEESIDDVEDLLDSSKSLLDRLRELRD